MDSYGPVAPRDFAMTLRARPMQPRDVRQCVAIIAAHPVIGPRYGSAIKDLQIAWLRLLDTEALVTTVFEELIGTRVTILGMGVSIFLREEYLDVLKKPPLRWIGPELAKQIARGETPHPSDKQLRDLNSRGGVIAMSWEGCIRPEFEKRYELFHYMMSTFLGLHRGYLWKEQLAPQAESAERVQWTLDAGGHLWDAAQGCYVKSLGSDLRAIAKEPHILGITREMERNRPSSWVGALFDYRPPQLGLSRSEQGLLAEALHTESGTDEELARALNVSLPSVKKMWLSIYRRVSDKQPQIIPDSGNSRPGKSERGKEKRRRLLSYLREHPEELRPVNHRLLEPCGSQRKYS